MTIRPPLVTVAATPTPDAGAPWLIVAAVEQDRGVREVLGEGDNPRIVEYLRSVSSKWGEKLRAQLLRDVTPWCSAFANWCMGQCGVPGTGKANARSWLKWGRACEPKVGAVCVLSRGNAWQGHVAFVVAIDTLRQRVLLRGGNQRNRVCEQWYPMDRVIGYRWPSEA
jgi:uncharacterized protein (TIGR02594 family)